MNILGYLYVKFKEEWPKFGSIPRWGIATPPWIAGLLGFGDIFYSDKNIIISYLNLILLFLAIYLIVYALLPKKVVEKNYKTWLKKHKRTTVFWSFLYLFSGITIGILIMELRMRF